MRVIIALIIAAVAAVSISCSTHPLIQEITHYVVGALVGAWWMCHGIPAPNWVLHPARIFRSRIAPEVVYLFSTLVLVLG